MQICVRCADPDTLLCFFTANVTILDDLINARAFDDPLFTPYSCVFFLLDTTVIAGWWGTLSCAREGGYGILRYGIPD